MSDRMQRMIARVLDGGIVRRRRVNPVVGLYRWRYEAVLLVGLGWWGWAGATYGAPVWGASAAVVCAAAAVLATWPPARRFVARRYWAVVVQHRLRTGFHETGLSGLSGRLPVVCWAVPRGTVVRVFVLLPAGVDVAAVTAERGALAAAAFASDVRVERHRRFANVLELVVDMRTTGRPGAG